MSRAYKNGESKEVYDIVFDSHTLHGFTYLEAEKEINKLFRAFNTVGATASIVSPVTGKIVDIYYLDKDNRIGYVAIN